MASTTSSSASGLARPSWSGCHTYKHVLPRQAITPLSQDRGRPCQVLSCHISFCHTTSALVSRIRVADVQCPVAARRAMKAGGPRPRPRRGLEARCCCRHGVVGCLHHGQHVGLALGSVGVVGKGGSLGWEGRGEGRCGCEGLLLLIGWVLLLLV